MIYLNLFPGGKTKALTLSYDDGVDQDIRLIEIMNRYGLRGTFNLNSGYMDGIRNIRPDGRSTHCKLLPEECKTCYAGNEIAVHGYKHAFLNRMPSDMMAFEISQDKYNLEKIAGYPVRGMAYAYGAYNDDVIERLKKLGIVYSRTTKATERFDLPEEFLAWHPTCHHNHPRLFELCDQFLQDPVRHDFRVFYVWGHSYEFDSDDNWDRIEEFCRKVGGQENIWYATNIEIYDYIQAARRLVTSCDGELIYNPSAVDVWVTKDNEKVCIPAGKTISLSK